MRDFTRILYLIPIHDSDPEHDSFFQGYSKGIIDYHRYVFAALKMPASLSELYFSKSECAKLAMLGINYHDIAPFEENLIYSGTLLEHVFSCIISDDRTYDSASKYCQLAQFKPLHLTYSKSKNSDSIHIDNINHRKIVSHFKKIYKEARHLVHSDLRSIIDSGLKKARKHPAIRTNIYTRHHNILNPGISVLERLKYQPKYRDQPLVGSDSLYIDEMLLLGTEIRKITNRFRNQSSLFSQGIDCILEYPGGFEMAPKDGMPIKQQLDARDLITAYNKFVKLEKGKENYAGSISGKDFVECMENESFIFLNQVRMEELSCYMTAISVMASNYLSPTIRLSPSVRKIRSTLFDLRGCLTARPNARKPFKANAITRNIYKILNDSVDTRIQNFIKESHRIKIICDYPIEWLKIDGLPLMLSRNVSRLYPVPGNVFFQHAINAKHHMMSVQDLFSITVIRSFSANDSIKGILERALNSFTYENVRITIIDVHSEREFRDVLNACTDNVVVFDCHGYYEKTKGVSYLKIGQDNVDIFSLRKQCRIPPIVILSACETFPVVGRHANVANSFVSCGAMSVIGTYFEVDAMRSAAMVARLFLRIDMYVPLLSNSLDAPTSWMDIVSGMFRMIYSSDMISSVLQFYKNRDKDKEIGLKKQANMHINSGSRHWHKSIIDDLSKALGVGQSDIRTAIEQVQSWSDVMSYVHIGIPEKIMIKNKTMYDLMNRQSQ
jgi:hypothetical protein